MSVNTGAMTHPVVPSPRELVKMKSLECTPTRRLSGQSGKGKSAQPALAASYWYEQYLIYLWLVVG